MWGIYSGLGFLGGLLLNIGGPILIVLLDELFAPRKKTKIMKFIDKPYCDPPDLDKILEEKLERDIQLGNVKI